MRRRINLKLTSNEDIYTKYKMFTDTDSLFYEIKTDDVYEDLLKDKELFDNSDYLFFLFFFFFFFNKKVTGKMKAEAAGMLMKEFTGLRSKPLN